MSRYYEMMLHVRGAKPDRVDAIKEAAAAEWPFVGWDPLGVPDDFTNFYTDGRDSLYGGEGEDEFAKRLARAIWKANDGYCGVEVRATYLEEVPCETYGFDEGDYEELVGEASGTPSPADEPSDVDPGNPVNLDAAGWGDVYERQPDIEDFIDHDHSMDG